MDGSPLIDKISVEQQAAVNDEEKVNMFNTKIKTWKIRELQQLLLSHIVCKVASILIPVTNVQDKII